MSWQKKISLLSKSACHLYFNKIFREEPVLLNHPDKNTEAVAQQLLKQHGSSLGKNTEDGESLLSMAASSGYYELCQVMQIEH